jgi:hypothetical protein
MSWQEWVDHAVENYKESLRPEIRHLLSRFHLCDVACSRAISPMTCC